MDEIGKRLSKKFLEKLAGFREKTGLSTDELSIVIQETNTQTLFLLCSRKEADAYFRGVSDFEVVHLKK